MKKYDSNSEGKWKTVEFVGNLSYPAKFMVKFSSNYTGLSLRAGAGDFPRQLIEWPPPTFIGKYKKNRTKRNP